VGNDFNLGLELGLQREECGMGGCNFLDFEGIMKCGFSEERPVQRQEQG